jgi:isopropylmalate/homocitrate/citramalate synthase
LTDVQPDSTEGKIMDIIIAIWSLAVAGTVIGVVGGMSLINVFIETAESAFEKKRKKSDDEEESEEPDAEEETKELGKRVSALEHAMRQKDDALKKILAAVSR